MRSKQEVWTPPAFVPHHHEGPCECEPTVAYIRVSMVGERDPESLRTPEIQLDACIEASRNKNRRIVAVLPDINASGRNFRRKRVQEAIDMIKKGKAKSVTIWKLSRWGRNVEYSKLYKGQVERAGGKVHSATEEFDLTTAVGRFSQTQVMAFDEFQSDMIGESWQAAQRKRREEGLPHSGRSRFGYIYISRAVMKVAVETEKEAHDGSNDCEKCQQRQPHFVPHPVEGPELKKCYEDFLRTKTFGPSVRRLNALGLKTPLGNKWTYQALSQMLDNGFGAGFIREKEGELLEQARAMRAADGKQMKNGFGAFNSWRKGSHKAIIGPDTWESYQEARTSAKLPAANKKATHVLSSLPVCSLCARRLVTRYPGKKKLHSWQCYVSKHTISNIFGNATLIKIVKEWVVENAGPDDQVEAIADKLRGGSKADDVKAQGALGGEIKRLQKKLENLLEMRTDGDISKDEYRVKKREYEAEMDKLATELNTIRRGQTGARPTTTAFQGVLDVWDKALPAELNEALSELIGMIVISPAYGVRTHDIMRQRVEIVGAWEMTLPKWQQFLDARYKRAS